MNNAEYIKRILQVHAEEVNTLAMRNYKLEKALDKACKYVNDIHSCPLDTFGFEVKGGCDSVCLERMEDSSLCWKEWALDEG